MKRKTVNQITEAKPAFMNLPAASPKQELKECVVFKHPGISPDVVLGDNGTTDKLFINSIDSEGQYVMNYVEVPTFTRVPMYTAIDFAAGDSENPSLDCDIYGKANPDILSIHFDDSKYNQSQYFVARYNTIIKHLMRQARKITFDAAFDSLSKAGVPTNFISEQAAKHCYEGDPFIASHIKTILFKAYSSGDVDVNSNAVYGILSNIASAYIANSYTRCLDRLVEILYNNSVGTIDIGIIDTAYAVAADVAYDAYYSLGKNIFEICKTATDESYLVYLSMYPEYKADNRYFNDYEF